MRSMLQALIWNSLYFSMALRAFMLAVCMLPLAVYGVLSSISSQPLEPQADPMLSQMEMAFLPFVIFILLLGAGLSHSNNKYLYTKPISNLGIAAWHLIGGAVGLAISTAAVVTTYNQMYSVGWPLKGSVLFIVAAWFVAQPFFLLAGRSFTNTIVTLIPFPFISGWLGTRYIPLGGPRTDWNEITSWETAQLLSISAVFAWLTLKCMPLARSQESLKMPEWVHQLGRSILAWDFDFTAGAKPFRSAQRALFWYEWRWKGLGIVLTMLFLACLVIPTELFKSFSLQGLHKGLVGTFMFSFLPVICFGILSGFQLEATSTSFSISKDSVSERMSTFQATRPVTDAALARAMLLACLGGVATALGLWLIFAVPVWIVAWSSGQLEELWQTHDARVVPVVAVGMWVALANCVSITSSGRVKLATGFFFIVLSFFVALLFTLEWVENPAVRRAILLSLAVIFVVCLAAFTILAYVWAMRRQHVTRFGLVMAIAMAAIVTAIGFSVPTTRNLEISVAIITTAILCILPWATTPIAVSHNRHR